LPSTPAQNQRETRRVYWLGTHATPYHDYFLTQLSQSLPGLEVTYSKPRSSSHPWSSRFGDGYQTRIGETHLGIDWGSLRRVISEREAFFVVIGWQSWSHRLALLLMRLLRRAFVVWTDTPRPVDSPRSFRERMRRGLLAWLFAGARAVFATGTPGVDGVTELGAPRDRAVSFPFFVDLPRFQRTSWERPEGKPLHFVSSGRILHWRKGHDVALQALTIASRRTGMPFRYSIAGTGPDQQSLQELAQRLGVSDSLELLGWTEPDQLAVLLTSADCLIHSAPTPDPFPNAVLEGMAAGLVVFASDVSGSAKDRIVHGENGFVHPAGDVETLASQIVTCMADVESLRMIGERAAANAREWPVSRGVDMITRLVDAGAGSD
jgi:glycosyltransferase involved in cell wall biosynthesis